MKNETLFHDTYVTAYTEGMKAGTNHTPRPMVVGSPKTFLGTELDTTKPMELVNDGVCGFASVQIKPANHRFAKWLLAKGYARKDSYHGGIAVWVHEFGQSYERKSKFAGAFASVVQEKFPELKSVWVNSRLD